MLRTLSALGWVRRGEGGTRVFTPHVGDARRYPQMSNASRHRLLDASAAKVRALQEASGGDALLSDDDAAGGTGPAGPGGEREEDRAARRIELRRRNAEQARRHRGASSRCDTRLSTPVEQRRRHLRKPPDPDLVAELARALAGQL